MSDLAPRLQAALEALLRPFLSRVDYLALYPAKVLVDHGDNTVDVEPDDQVLPRMVKVPVRTFMPGVTLTVEPGARVLVGFAGGSPARPECQLWQAGTSVKVTIAAGTVIVESDDIYLVAEGATKHVAFKEDVEAELAAHRSAINNHTHTVSGFTAGPSLGFIGPAPSLGSTKVRCG